MNQQQLIAAIKQPMDIEAVRGLFLAGSFGRGTADAWSDVDLIAVVAEGEERHVADHWRTALHAITPIVFWQELPRGVIVLNDFSEERLRWALTIGPARGFGRRAT